MVACENPDLDAQFDGEYGERVEDFAGGGDGVVGVDGNAGDTVAEKGGFEPEGLVG